MNELVTIGNQEITMKEFNNQRVVTLRDIDLVHERPEGTAKRNFTENRNKFIEGEDYINVSLKDENRTLGFEIPNRGITLITEQGYLMLVKSFTDDLAWKVQRQLVNTYFRARKPISALEQLQLNQQAILEVNVKVEDVARDLQSFKKDMPLLGIEETKITTAVRRKGVNCLGGKESNAYQDRSLRGRVYADIYGQLKREFAVGTYKAIKRSQCDMAVGIINNYELPLALEEEVKDCNSQLVFWLGGWNG